LTCQFAAALITSRSSGKTPAKTCKASVAAVRQAVVRRRRNPLWAEILLDLFSVLIRLMNPPSSAASGGSSFSYPARMPH
jgi:hypothetical protein